MINATVGILTFNNEKNLNNCLKSVKKFKDIVILDGGSTDKTLGIARKYKCKIYKQPSKFKFKNNKIKNFSKMKDMIIKLSKYNLILFLDTDEILDKSILKKIDFYSKCKYSPKKYYSFLLGRFPIYKKKIIKKKTILYPNFQERLIYKSNVKNFIKPVHERPLRKNSDLRTKRISNTAIKFTIDFNNKKLYEKYDYYIQIEKLMLKNSSIFFKKLKFIVYRLMNIFKYVFQDFIFRPKKIDKDFRKFEMKHIKFNTYFSLKLLTNIFT